ncbi:MAG TPA: oxygenase MpaB family protein, partial [Cyclobacteriaceae bacterium]|nr:oxygenase MpaB family protein [Cyclobacteriaceae bacterium]
DTANFVIGVSTPGSFEENGLAQREINKTRLIHALARYYLLKSDWQMDWGLPINQEDMAGTNLAFSYITLMGLRKSGFTLTAKQEEDFIYLWRYIGYQLYIEEILLPDSLHSAFHLTKIIEERNFKPNEEGVLLSRSLIDYYRNAIPDKQVANLMEAQLSFYLGEKVADFLKIKSDPLAMNIIKLRMSLQAWQNYFKVQVPTYQQMLLNQEQFEKAIKHETSSRSHT